jgi:ABC-2 type transport system permease protein
MYWIAADSLTLIGRSLRHSLRSIDALLTAALLPVLLLLMFVYVFGGAIAPGGDYVDYVVPAIILLSAGFGAATTAVSVNQDMTTGVIDRFRSLDIHGSAVLTGPVVASVARNVISTVLVLAVALLIGYSPNASAAEWLGVLGLLLLFMLAVSWPAAAFGLLAGGAEAAGSFSFFILFAPYVSSAFVPPESMPGVLEAIAEHQPITPIVDTLRALMLGTPTGDAAVAVAWCAGFAVLGAVSAALLFSRRRAGA